MQAPAWAGHDNGVRLTDSMDRTESFSGVIDAATRSFNAANVAVFPIQVRGLTGRIPGETTIDESVAVDGNAQTMLKLAAATGGRAFLGNSIEAAIEQATDPTGVVYTLGFYVDPAPAKPEYHRIDVTLANHSGASLRTAKVTWPTSGPHPTE